MSDRKLTKQQVAALEAAIGHIEAVLAFYGYRMRDVRLANPDASLKRAVENIESARDFSAGRR